MRFGWLGAIVLGCCPLVAAVAESPSEAVQRGFQEYQAEHCPEAIAILKDVVAAPSFSPLSPELRYSGLWALSVCYYQTSDYAASSRIAARLTENRFATYRDWELRFWASVAARDNENSGIALSYLVEHHFESLANWEAQTIFQVVEGEKKTPTGRARNATILERLFAAKWRPSNEPANTTDFLWVQLVRSDLKDGKRDHARLVAATITAPSAREAMWADRTFDPITGGDPKLFGIEAYYAEELARVRAEMASHPDLLSYVVAVAQLLIKLDHQDEALTLLDNTLVAMKVKGRFRDMDQANWIENYRADALIQMGHSEVGRAQMEAAAQENEKEGRDKVSQAINLAGIYCTQGLPEEGLKALKRVDIKNASPYGVMAAEEARACAYALKDDKAGLAQSVGFVQAHAVDAPLLAIRVMLYAKDGDGAAKLLLRFLADPDTRSQVLATLHHHKTSRYPAAADDFDTPGLKWSILAERADIKAAVESFGRILDLPTIGAW